MNSLLQLCTEGQGNTLCRICSRFPWVAVRVTATGCSSTCVSFLKLPWSSARFSPTAKVKERFEHKGRIALQTSKSAGTAHACPSHAAQRKPWACLRHNQQEQCSVNEEYRLNSFLPCQTKEETSKEGETKANPKTRYCLGLLQL